MLYVNFVIGFVNVSNISD